jgi:cytochrome c oxidase subunit 4
MSEEIDLVEERKSTAFRQINLVILALAVLTGIEFAISVTWGSAVILFLIALIKAGLIVQFFMHVYRLWREESH